MARLMNRFFWTLAYVAAGITFWLPSIGAHAASGNQFGNRVLDLIGVVILPVVTSWITLGILTRKRAAFSGRGVIAFWMLLGIWMFGPLCTMIGASFSGGGFSQAGTWHMVWLGLVLFVPLTFMMSTYDGTLGPLAIVTIWFILIATISFFQSEQTKAT
jgi:hypothetical protein